MAAQIRALDSQATHAVVIDVATGQSLLEKNADAVIPPASMSKLMTTLMVFEALEQGRLSLEDRFAVSANAFQKEGSTMFLNLTDEPTVAELLRGVIVQSGNDACIALAEGLAGSERAFSERMTKRAAELGLEGAHFMNATGLPEPGHVMSVRHLAKLALLIIERFPQYYSIYSEPSFSWADVEQRNRNPLLAMDIGGDGLKTGHTDEAGYGIVGSAEQDGRRVVAVVAGLPDDTARKLEIRRVLTWAFREFENRVLARPGDVVAEAEVWLGARASAPLTVTRELKFTIPVGAAAAPEAVLRYEGPVRAPIEAGQSIGALEIEIEGLGKVTEPLVAAEPVAAGGYLDRLSAGAGLAAGWAMRRAMEAAAGDDAETAPQ